MSSDMEAVDTKPSGKGPSKKKSSSRGGGNGRSYAKSKSSYKGRMAAIDGIHHVYDMVPGRADMYITTTNEITRKFGVDYGPDVARSLKAEKRVTYPMPSMPQVKDSTTGVARDMKRDELSFIQEKQIGGLVNMALANEEKLKTERSTPLPPRYTKSMPFIAVAVSRSSTLWWTASSSRCGQRRLAWERTWIPLLVKYTFLK